MRRLSTIKDRIKNLVQLSSTKSYFNSKNQSNLCIIITGQLRNFINKSSSHFHHVIQLSKQYYSYILIIAIVSADNNQDLKQLQELLDFISINYLIINYNSKKYQDEFDTSNHDKIKSEKYMEIKSNYLKSDNSAKNEIMNIEDCLNKFSRQFHQLQIGISKLLEFEFTHNITFDIIMKTRFDVYYPPNFYPHVFDESECLLKKLLFNDTNIDLFQSCMESNNIQNLDELIQFIKQQEIKLPKCRINFDYINMTFGGWNYYNYTALENIINGSDDILYSFNDFFYFAKRSLFLQLKDLYNQCFLLEPINNMHHIYAPESQLIMHCLEKNINIVMYNDGSKNYSGSFGLIR